MTITLTARTRPRGPGWRTHALGGALSAALSLAPLAAWAADAAPTQTPIPALKAAIADPARSPGFVARDAARHPAQELTFFGLKPTQTVVEIWPSGGYWTEILAPYLRQRGTYVIAQPKPLAPDAPMARKLAASPQLYDKVRVTVTDGSQPLAAPGSVDLVLTFRNLHNWMKAGDAPRMLASFYRVLKPGGVLGLEEHRGNRHVAQDPQAKDGYVNQDAAIALARQAGFVLVGTSEMDANPKDTAQWPKGVWTLPPTYALGATDHDKYAAIGEADNVVLKFRKP